MRPINFCLKLFFVLTLNGCNQNNNPVQPPVITQLELPKWTWVLLEKPQFKEKFTFDFRINPFYLQADFDKDGFLDMAILIKERKSGKAGLALLRQGESGIVIYGAGRSTGFGGKNWDWLSAWKTESVLPAGANISHAGAVLILFPKDKNKNSSWLYWNGQKWQWKAD